MWSTSSAGRSPAKSVWVTCVYVNSRDKVDEWHTSFAVFFPTLGSRGQLWLVGLFSFFFSFFCQLWLICVISSLSSLSSKNYYNPLRLLKSFHDERESVVAAVVLYLVTDIHLWIPPIFIFRPFTAAITAELILIIINNIVCCCLL